MVPPDELSAEQLRVLDPDVRVVEAGPGSGKTRALVARYLQEASRPERGVALLSFTNAAVDEARRRASSAPHLLRAPHFVGTIDTFLHRFVVTPAEVRRLRRLPSYLRSWDDLTDDFKMVRLRQPPGYGVPLSAFRKDESDTVTLS